MKASMRTVVALSIAALIGVRATAQEPEAQRVPVLRDLPILSNLFQTGSEEVLWHPFPSDENEQAGAAGPRPFELRLLRMLRARVPALRKLEFVGKSTTRADAETTTTQVERGIEARGPKEALAVAREFLRKFDAARERTLRIEVSIITTETGPPGKPVDVEIIDRARFDRRMKEPVEILSAPKLLVYHNQPAEIRVSNQVAYVKDFEIRQVEGSVIADPVVDVVEDGIFLQCTAMLDPESEDLLFDASIKLSTLVRPIRTLTSKIDGFDAELTFQLPEIRSSNWKSEDLKLRPGEAGFVVRGLILASDEADFKKFKNVEVWFLVTAGDQPSAAAVGEVVAVDLSQPGTAGTVIVKWPRDAVPDEPWAKAPENVAIFDGDQQVGTAHRQGGWELGSGAAREVRAVYALQSGTAAARNSVRPLPR